MAEAAMYLLSKNRFGFLAEVTTPTPTDARSMVEYGWGYTISRWVYAETLSDLVDKIKAWTISFREKMVAELIENSEKL